MQSLSTKLKRKVQEKSHVISVVMPIENGEWDREIIHSVRKPMQGMKKKLKRERDRIEINIDTWK